MLDYTILFIPSYPTYLLSTRYLLKKILLAFKLSLSLSLFLSLSFKTIVNTENEYFMFQFYVLLFNGDRFHLSSSIFMFHLIHIV